MNMQSPQKSRRDFYILLGIIFFTFFLSYGCTMAGFSREDRTEYFQEKEAVTFLSALLLGCTCLTSMLISYIHRKLDQAKKLFNFWGLSSMGFFYLCMDEYFMGHEGVIAGVIEFFGGNASGTHYDGYMIGIFGLVALLVCVWNRKEILKYKDFIRFSILGGVGLFFSVFFDQMVDFLNHDFAVIIEETSKIFGVTCFFAAFLATLYDFLKRLMSEQKCR